MANPGGMVFGLLENSMLVQCKLIRDGGTVVTVGGCEYRFAPNAAGDHVAEVGDEGHVGVFLGIPESYCAYGRPEAVEESALPADVSLDAMGKAELIALAGERGVEVNPKASVAALRKQLAGA